MLIEFRVENHRSLREEQVLSMEATGRGDDPRLRSVDAHAKKLLPVAGIYGGNASGKTNVLCALHYMAIAVRVSHRIWEPDTGVNREPFRNEASEGAPSLFEQTFVAQGIRYQYGFVVDDDSVLEEWLYAWPKRKKQTWFERDRQSFSWGRSFKAEQQVLERVVRPNALALTMAAQLNSPSALRVSRWFLRLLQYRLPMARRGLDRRSATFPLRDEILRKALGGLLLEPDSRGQVLELVRTADLGVDDIRIATERGEEHVQLRHPGLSAGGWLASDQESLGTQSLLDLIPSILITLDSGGLLLIDELEASMHPNLAEQIVALFQDPETNPKNGQLVFSTHNTNLLGTARGQPALRRDQVWLTEKGPDGGTHLYPLTDYKPRKQENLERGYLQGRYGGIPYLGELLSPNPEP